MFPGLFDGVAVDVHGGDDGVVAPLPVVGFVADPDVVAFVPGGDAPGNEHLVQAADVADGRGGAARAGRGVLFGLVGADVTAVGADAPPQPGRAFGAADVQPGDLVFVALGVEVVAGGEVLEGEAGGAGVRDGLGVVLAAFRGLLAPGEDGLQFGGGVDEAVVGQQAEVDEGAVGGGPAQNLDDAHGGAALGAEFTPLPLVFGVAGDEQPVGAVDGLDPALGLGAPGLPLPLGILDARPQPLRARGDGIGAQVGRGLGADAGAPLLVVRREEFQEGADQPLAVGEGGLGELGPPCLVAEEFDGHPGQRADGLVAGGRGGQPPRCREVEEVGEVLAAQDLGGGEVAAGGWISPSIIMRGSSR